MSRILHKVSLSVREQYQKTFPSVKKIKTLWEKIAEKSYWKWEPMFTEFGIRGILVGRYKPAGGNIISHVQHQFAHSMRTCCREAERRNHDWLVDNRWSENYDNSTTVIKKSARRQIRNLSNRFANIERKRWSVTVPSERNKKWVVKGSQLIDLLL